MSIYFYDEEAGTGENMDLREVRGTGTYNPTKFMDDYLSEKMAVKNETLLTVLDLGAWKSMDTIMYECSLLQLVGIVKTWFEMNSETLVFDKYYPDENQSYLTKPVELPLIRHSSCPRNANHGFEIIKARDGIIRCGHTEIRTPYSDNFDMLLLFDPLAGMYKNYFCGKVVEEEYEGSSERTELVDTCYAILSEDNFKLSLEEVFRRHNLAKETQRFYHEDDSCIKRSNSDGEQFNIDMCMGHNRVLSEVAFPFEAIQVVGLVKAWYEQFDDKSKLKFFNNRNKS